MPGRLKVRMATEVRTPRLLSPVMSDDERDAAVIVLRHALRKLEVRDADKVSGAIEALTTAPPFTSSPLSDPAANAMGRFQRSSETSRRAAIDNYPRSGSQRLDVLHRIAREGAAGATRDELVKWLGRSPQSVTPRVKELVEGGWLETRLDGEGNTCTRVTRAGSAAAVLVLSARAKQELRRRGMRLP